MMWICSRGEKCRSDLKKKLKDWNVPVDYWDELLKQLEHERFLDEERYTNFYVRDKIRFNKWGRGKVRFQLKMKQLPEDLVNDVLLAFDDEEYCELVEAEVRQKHRKTKGANKWEIKSKLLRFAQSRGYEYDLVNTILDKINKEEE